MMAGVNRRIARERRHVRVRNKLEGTPERPRLCVFRSLQHIYAQVIDDAAGTTLVSAGTLDPDLKETVSGKNKSQRAEIVGSLVAQRAIKRGVKKVVFDRGGYKYQGRVKVLADAARKAGLEF
ncbi:MAG TPA: 50S ribosomal protein L18 [Dehalococcoidia bacterium]|nr:50S ribosomal protein L18 [Dehalococcoidia bacterium]